MFGGRGAPSCADSVDVVKDLEVGQQSRLRFEDLVALFVSVRDHSRRDYKLPSSHVVAAECYTSSTANAEEVQLLQIGLVFQAKF